MRFYQFLLFWNLGDSNTCFPHRIEPWKLALVPMAKTVRLTWGLSLWRLKIPSFLLDAGIDKQSISTSAVVAASTSFKLRSHPLSRHRYLRKSLESLRQTASGDDSELTLIIDSPNLSSQCTEGKVKMMHAGGRW